MSNSFIRIIQNPILQRHLDRVASKTGIDFIDIKLVSDLRNDVIPTMIVFEIELKNALELITKWKVKWPKCFLAAAVTHPDKELWMAANAAGCDLVSNRGSLPKLLRKKIEAYLGGVEGLTPETICLMAKPVVNPGDGLVARLPDNPEDPICVFRIGNEYFGIRDVCPHAGFALADGDFDASTGIVTCPEHGSRFNVHSGERVRGPADYSIKSYPVTTKGNDIYVHV